MAGLARGQLQPVVQQAVAIHQNSNQRHAHRIIGEPGMSIHE
jgi:hypothetical protein